MPREQALYVIVRKDLKRSSPAVQAGHALAQFLLDHKTEWQNGTLVYLSVPNEAKLLQIKALLGNRQLAEFKEPDLENQLTAVAVLGSKESRLSDFGDLSLL
jgi:hypothetical protein